MRSVWKRWTSARVNDSKARRSLYVSLFFLSPQYFIFAHFYPTCRNTSGVERAMRFITEVLGDGRVVVGGGGFQSKSSSEKLSKHLNQCDVRKGLIAWTHHCPSRVLHSQKRAQTFLIQYKSSSAGGKGLLPDKNKNRNLATTGVH